MTKLLLGKWRLVLERAPEPIVLLRQRELTERQMNEALAQSCQHSVSHSVQQPDLSGGSEKSDVSNKPTAAQSLRTTPVMDTSKSSDLPAQNTERGDASCPTMAQPTPGSKAGPESSNPPAAASECGDPRNPNKECLYDEYRIGPKLCIYCRKPKTAASEAQQVVTDTPRTNAASVEISRPSDGDKLDWISFARQLERELNQANATVAALRRELEEWQRCAKIRKQALHDADARWTKAEADRDQLRRELAEAKLNLAIASDKMELVEADRDQWKKRAEGWKKIADYLTEQADKPNQPEVWHDYATDPPKEKDGVVVGSHGFKSVWRWYPDGTIMLVAPDFRPTEPGCKWARITWPPVPAEPVQDKDEEAAQYAADHIFQPLMGEVTISDSQHRVIRNYAITVAKAALRHARATEEKK